MTLASPFNRAFLPCIHPGIVSAVDTLLRSSNQRLAGIQRGRSSKPEPRQPNNAMRAVPPIELSTLVTDRDRRRNQKTGCVLVATPARYAPNVVQSPLETYLREINETALLAGRRRRNSLVPLRREHGSPRTDGAPTSGWCGEHRPRPTPARDWPSNDLIEEAATSGCCAVEGFDPTMNTRSSALTRATGLNRASAGR